MMHIEVCTDTLINAFDALQLGADRIELCSSLSLGGITPSIATFKILNLSFPNKVHILIRPRMGGFCYDRLEKKQMLQEIEDFASASAHEIVVGALTSQNTLDYIFLEEILTLFPKIRFTFHRAIDETMDPIHSAKELSDLGFVRILTSGGSVTAIAGISILQKMMEVVSNNTEIMPGGGITDENLVEIWTAIKPRSIHMSLKQWFVPEGAPVLNLNTIDSDPYGYWRLNKEAMIRALDKKNIFEKLHYK